MSVQSLNQSRTSIQGIGLETSQSQPQSQIPSYCTLPRHSIGQTATGSAFHPVARSAPSTPKTERPMTRVTSTMPNSRTDLQIGRSISQPSSPTSAPTVQSISSVYSVKKDTITSTDPPVQMLPARKGTVTSSGNNGRSYNNLVIVTNQNYSDNYNNINNTLNICCKYWINNWTYEEVFPTYKT